MMDEREFRPSEGSCYISEDVVAAIASSAAMEVQGVAGMAQKPGDIRGLIGASANRSVSIVNNENMTTIDVYIRLSIGAVIPEVAGRVQRSVKTAVQSMTGKPVTRVNVHVVGLAMDSEKN